MNAWTYIGDVNIREGGYYWREDDSEDYVLAVQVTPCSDAGGPANMFWIESGSIYLGDTERQNRALDCIGVEPANATRADYVDAVKAYYGIEPDCYMGRYVVQLGKRCGAFDKWQWDSDISADVVLHGNANLRRYIEREHCN